MLKAKRKALILEIVAQQDIVSVEALMQCLASSESTVRRDLAELELEGRLARVHGGAQRLHPLQEELSISQKSVKNIQLKKILAQKASDYMQPNDVVFIDAGTTTQCLIDYLSDPSIIVVTNCIHHAARLVDKGIRTSIIGGFIKPNTDATIGQSAIEQLKQFNFDRAFIGMNGADLHYLTTPDPEEAAIKRTIIQQSKHTYVLMDGTKLGWQSLVNVSPVTDVTIITTQTSHPLLNQLKERTEVVVV